MKEQVVYTIKINIEVYRSIVLNRKLTAEGEWGGGGTGPLFPPPGSAPALSMQYMKLSIQLLPGMLFEGIYSSLKVDT